MAREACRKLAQYARVFPIGGPRASLLKGRLSAIEGNHKQAIQKFAKSLALMAYEEGLARLELSRHLFNNNSHYEHEVAAADIFRRLRIVPDLALLSDRRSSSVMYLSSSGE
jgi:hypothetical protein